MENITLDGKKMGIRLDKDNLEFIIHASSKIAEIRPSEIVLDVRDFNDDIKNITQLAEMSKSADKVICVVNKETSPELKEMLKTVGIILDVDQIEFKNQEEKQVFEDYEIDGAEHFTNEEPEVLSTISEDDYLNIAAKNHLQAIIKDYEEVLTDEQKERLAGLLETNMVVVEKDHEAYAKFKESIGEKEDPKDYPSAHGGKIYGDGKIHIYLDKFKENDMEAIEGVLVHELFHYVISPEYSEKYPEEERFNSHITEGMVDAATLDYMTKNNIFNSYQSDYNSEVIFVKEKLKNIPDEESKKALCVRGSIDQFIEQTSKTEVDFMNDYHQAMNHATKYDMAVEQISSLDPAHKDGYSRSMMRLAARTSPEEALQTIKETMNEMTPTQLGMTPEQAAKMKQEINMTVDSYSASNMTIGVSE